jgi:hypothetical protein
MFECERLPHRRIVVYQKRLKRFRLVSMIDRIKAHSSQAKRAVLLAAQPRCFLPGCMGRGESTDVALQTENPDLLTIRGWRLLNAGDTSDAEQEIPGDRQAASVFGLCAPLADDVGLRELPPRKVPGRGERRAALRDPYPTSPDAAYAQYLIGESYFRQIPT